MSRIKRIKKIRIKFGGGEAAAAAGIEEKATKISGRIWRKA